ncbi:MAG TPA: TonB-dependent receptor [Bryobacteraceae bacterium]|nr:TonB-dependent receptor [Bryobacteraceae bacterium]
MNAHWFGGAARAAAILALGSVVAPSVSVAATNKLLGSLTGSVRDTTGTPQMGAVVQLFNRFERPVERVLTNGAGEFMFASLLPDLYSIRVTMNSFMPALKRNIAVPAGGTSVLAINLASVLSSVELVYSSPTSGALMSDEWRWVLRSSMSTRPVLRIFEENQPGGGHGMASFFSDTKGMIKVSAGEGTPLSYGGNQPDLGTTFALATSLFGGSHLQVTGNVGYGMQSDLPATGFRTSFSPGTAGGPSVKLTMQQVSLPIRGTSLVGGGAQSNAPSLRTMSLTFIERTEVADGIDLEYGASLDSVTFMDRLNYFSPFARLTYEVGDHSRLQMGYSSGAPALELLQGTNDSDPTLQRDMMALAVLPRVSLRDGQARVQRSQNMEIGYELEAGSRTFSVALYREVVGNGALTMSTPSDFSLPGELLPELSSTRSSVFNIGRYQRIGYTATLTQQVNDRFSTAVTYGRGGVLTTREDAVLATMDANELRDVIVRSQRHWVRGRLSGVAPVMGTRFTASYEWSGSRTLTPGHVYLTQRLYPETGLNLRLRQPLPLWDGLPGRIEASAEVRNMLAQGYLPVSLADGRRLVLAHSPRAVRGGLSFIF